MSPPGTTWPTRRRFAAGYALALAVLFIDLLVTLLTLYSLGKTWQKLALSYDVVAGMDDVLSNLRDAETGQRGYLLTGDERYLEPYTKSHAVIIDSIDHLRSLVGSDATERQQVEDIAQAASAKLAELEQTIKARRENGPDAALAIVKADHGRMYMDQVRSAIATMRARENATRSGLRDHFRAMLMGTTLTFGLVSALAVSLLFGVHFLSERSRAQLDCHAAWLSTTLRSMGDAVIATDAQGLVTFLNPAAETLTGWTQEDAAGMPLEQVFLITNQITGEPAENPVARVLREGVVVGLANHTALTAPDGSACAIDDTAAPIVDDTGRIQGVVVVFGHFETQRLTKDGRIIDVSLGVSPIRDAAGTIIGAAKVARDITERRRAEAERERLLAAAESARAEAEAANRMKDEFLSTLSHELRTPLNAIVGWAKILRSSTVDAEDLAEGLAAIDRNSQAQAQIIEDLLDISRITSGNLRLEVQRLALADIIEEALAVVLPAANAKEIRIHKVLDSLTAPVTGDPARLQQVVWNLLANAVKFTPRGGQVQVLLERVNSHVEISVIDTGIGIKPEFLPHVFDRFSQADTSTTRRYAGLGLGLAIVKRLVEMHGGSIRAKSPGEGQGATFTVALPITVVHPDRPESPKVRPRENSVTARDAYQDRALAGLKVLVVDDEPDARQVLRRALSDCHAEVIAAASAAEALEFITKSRPDVLVCDIGMPDEDGYDLIQQVRANPATRDIPAAALTAFARPEDRKRSLLAGFQTHIAKPVDPAELTAVVASLAFRTGRGD